MFKFSKSITSLMLTTGLLLGFNQIAKAADNFKIDSVHSTAVFSAKHYGVSNYYGRFNWVEGDIVFDKKNPRNTKVNLKIKADSIFTAHKKRDNHLKSPDFLNVKQFPWITFKSKTISQSGNQFKVTGDLSIHGVTKKIILTFLKVGEGKDPQGKIRAGGEARFSINRSDYGMKFGIPNLGDKIDLIVSLEGIKQ